MNRTKLKNYAPQARRDFIQAMTDRAAFFGLTEKKIEPIVERGDVAVIAGREYPRAVAGKRRALEDAIQRLGFNATMEAMAYTWFNRLVAIRFMELHGYLNHGYRVLSHPEGKTTPEILEQAEHVDFPGLKKDTVIDLKLAGNRESELYRLLLTAQCNALNSAMPFLFEKIDDETELLLPDNLLNSDSLVRKLVNEIDEEDWREVEIIGWLYQFYISERKDEVIGKVVASEDIPAATQLFTPNWIVKYLVQNTLGRQWLATYPESGLRSQMEYYIEPAEQTPEVQAQLAAITPTSLNPEELTLLDPACGSGHILVEAYDLFKAIYTERGYNKREIPRLILGKNLYGLEIDDRAAQLAAFALMMKARADDRRIFESDAKLNVIAFQESKGMDAAAITYALNSPIFKGEEPPKEFLFEEMEDEKTPLFSRPALAEKGHVSQRDIAALLELFENAKTFGSLIQIPAKLTTKLQEIENRIDDVIKHGNLTTAPAKGVKPLVNQSWLLARQYDAVVANPPYMGSKALNTLLKQFGKIFYPSSISDTFAMFLERSLEMCKSNSFVGVVMPFVWMYLSTYSHLRSVILSTSTISSLIQLEYNAFEPACVPVAAFSLFKSAIISYSGDFIKLSDFRGHEIQAPKTLEAINNPHCEWRFQSSSNIFRKLPESPIIYWLSPSVMNAFKEGVLLGTVVHLKQGLATSNNNRFLRGWFEVSFDRIGVGIENREEALKSGKRWFPYNKGGDFRKWFGNQEWVVNWEFDGNEIRNCKDEKGKQRSRPQNLNYFFKQSISWSKISSSSFVIRYYPKGFIFDVAGCSIFSESDDSLIAFAGLLNSKAIVPLLAELAPTMNFEVGQVANVPIVKDWKSKVKDAERIASKCISFARDDWDSHELSRNFGSHPLLDLKYLTFESAINSWIEQCRDKRKQVNELEEANNRFWIDSYGFQGQISPLPYEGQNCVTIPTNRELMASLMVYAIGCTMGRYSLDQPGLIYAHGGNEGFDHDQYRTFPADDDGIVPLLDTDWGIRDDATERFVEFIGVAWPREHLEENLKFVADSLGASNGEPPRDTIRHYLATGFYKHHLSMYKRRPIYWLFSSGKQRAFQCLVYLHRYNEGTLARMRTEYVIPLQGKIAARIEQLEGDKTKATSTSHRKKLQKEQDDLKRQQVELLTFDEKLKRYADMRISLDLDDGVKVNYGKFGDLLAEVKAVTGGKDEE